MIIRRRPGQTMTPGPEHLGIVCEHCRRPLGDVRTSGKVQLPPATFARGDGRLECRCAACRRDTLIPYGRAEVPA